MGAGCYYTNNETGTRAFWIDTEPYYTDPETGKECYDEFIFDDTIGNLKYTLESLGYEQESTYKFANGLYDLILESGHGNEIVFRLEPHEETTFGIDQKIYNLAMANHDKCYTAIAKKLCQEGYELRMATSGYTSGSYNPLN